MMPWYVGYINNPFSGNCNVFFREDNSRYWIEIDEQTARNFLKAQGEFAPLAKHLTRLLDKKRLLPDYPDPHSRIRG